MAMTFRIELVLKHEDGEEAQNAPSSIYLTKDGRVVLQGRALSQRDRAELDLPADAALISVDRALIQAIKEML